MASLFCISNLSDHGDFLLRDRARW